jgi:hypothetical protein
MLIGTEPPAWAEQTWEYAELAFVARQFPAADLAVQLLEAACGKTTLAEFEVTVPPARGPANWRRDPSFARLDRLPLPRPTTTYRITAVDQDYSAWPDTMLVGESCPSFPEPKSAWRAFTEGDFSRTGAQDPPHELAVIRIAESRAWISHVHVAPTKMTVDVQGDAAEGCVLELNSTADRTSQKLDGSGTVTLTLAGGLPDHAWLWLKHGTTWLDYLSIDPRSAWTGDLSRANVEIEVPVDPQANVEALIAAGEGPQVEFKEELVGGRKLKTVAAFATGNGGTIVYGINKDEVTVTGLGGDDPTKLRDHLGDLIQAAVIPTPDFTVTDYQIDDKTILVLDVLPGQSPPYGVVSSSDTRNKPEYYVRRGASTPPAQPSDLREAVRNRQ